MKGKAMTDPICARCGDEVSVDPELEWNDGDVCWTCSPDRIAELEDEVVRLRKALVAVRWLSKGGCHFEQTIERVVRLRNDILGVVHRAIGDAP